MPVCCVRVQAGGAPAPTFEMLQPVWTQASGLIWSIQENCGPMLRPAWLGAWETALHNDALVNGPARCRQWEYLQ